MPSDKSLIKSLIFIIILAIIASFLYTSNPPQTKPEPISKFTIPENIPPANIEETNIAIKPQFLPYIKGDINFFQEGTSLYLTLNTADNTEVFNNLMGNITLPYGQSSFPLDKTMVYLEADRSSVDIACHAWIDYQGIAHNCEKLRYFLEGPLNKPYTLTQALENSHKLIDGKTIIRQSESMAELTIRKITRLNPTTAGNTKQMSDKLNELTKEQADINLIICSRILEGDPGYDPNLYLGGYPDNTGRWIFSLKLAD